MKGKWLTRAVGNVYAWLMKRERKKLQKIQQNHQSKEEQKIYQKLQELYGFVKWLNTQALKTRRARKSFWRTVSSGRPLAENVLKDLIAKYADKINNKSKTMFPPKVKDTKTKNKTQENIEKLNKDMEKTNG